MIIKEFRAYQYTLELNGPLYVRNTLVDHREGIIIQLIDENNVSGFGEIAPLTNLHTDTFEDCREQCRALSAGFPGNDIPDNANQLTNIMNEYFKDFEFHHSVRFGIEMAILSLIANIQKKPLYQILPNPTHDYVQVNGLLSGDKDTVLHNAETSMKAGIVSFKLKASDSVSEDIEKVSALNKLFDGKAMLHIDVNQKWSLEQAKQFCEQCGFWSVEYIEEPFKDIKLIPEFNHNTTIPVALDESIEHSNLEELNHIEGVDVFVLKPSLIGSIEKTWQMMLYAQSMAIRPVLSSSFESGLTIHTIASLACNLQHESFAGIDTLKYFKKDILKNPLTINRGKMRVTQRMITEDDIDFSLCEPLC